MKRLSRKLRKRLSTSSREHTRQQEEDIYNGVSPTQDKGSPMENSCKMRPLPPSGDGVLNGNLYSNGPIDASTRTDDENHDYSTLDGDCEDTALDVFSEVSGVTQQQPPIQPLSAPSLAITETATHPSTNGPLPSANGMLAPDPIGSDHTRKTAKSANAKNPSRSSRPLMAEFQNLARKGWYWGPMTREQAERKLCNLPEASFLVRDSSDDRYLLSLSFRSNNKTLHTRIEHSGMKFSFYEDSPRQSYTSVIELIENSVRDSTEQGVFCYSRSRHPNAQTFPVRLMHPVSRFTEVRRLQDLCRFVIRQYTRVDHIQNLPLPRQIKGYLNQSYF